MRISEITSVNRSLGGFIVEALKLDIPHKILPREELHDYLDKTMSGKKSKQDRLTQPYIHKSNIISTDAEKYLDSRGKESNRITRITKTDNPDDVWDLDELAAQIMVKPDKAVLGKNAKMSKSASKKVMGKNKKMVTSSGDVTVYDITLPALRSIVVDEETGDFVVVTTCPNAGVCQVYCYARKGGYVMFPDASLSATRWLNFLLNHPDEFKKKASSEISQVSKKSDNVVVRWHDSGDFFSKQYLDMAFDIAKENPDVLFYAYTKSADFAMAEKPDNFIFTYSTGSTPDNDEKIARSDRKIKRSHVFNDPKTKQLISKVSIDSKGNKTDNDNKKIYAYNDKHAIKEMKQLVAEKYGVDINTVLTYEEMLEMPEGSELKWTVIVLPTSGDIAAQRKDVLNVVLVIH